MTFRISKKLILTALTILTAFLLAGCKDYTIESQALRDEGISLMQTGDYYGACTKFDIALSLSNGRITQLERDISFYKAAALYAANDYEHALIVYNALIKYDPEDWRSYFLRGCCYVAAGDIAAATADYTSAANINPSYQLYIQMYENLNQHGYTNQGIEFINDALVLKDESAEGYYYRGRIYYMLAQYDQANTQLSAAVQKGSVEAKVYLAKVYRHYGDEASASMLLMEYVRSDSVTADALAELGDIELNAGNFDEALSYYNAGLDMEASEHVRTQLLRGRVACLEHLLRWNEAKSAIREYLAEAPDDEEARREQKFIESR